MPNKAEWCTNDHVHLEHAGVSEGQVVVCDGLPPHPDVALLIKEAMEEHDERTDYDGLPYSPARCYACGVVDQGGMFEDHVAFMAAKAVLDRLRPFLSFPLDDDDDDDIFPPF